MSVKPYRETLGSLLYPGFQHSVTCLQLMVELAERLLRPKDRQRRRIIWRLDAGFGSDDAIKWLLSRDYQILIKGYNTRRAKKAALDVQPDDWQAVRPDKWVATVPTNIRYGRRVETLALKWLAPKSGERYALLLHTLGQSAAEAVKRIGLI